MAPEPNAEASRALSSVGLENVDFAVSVRDPSTGLPASGAGG